MEKLELKVKDVGQWMTQCYKVYHNYLENEFCIIGKTFYGKNADIITIKRPIYVDWCRGGCPLPIYDIPNNKTPDKFYYLQNGKVRSGAKRCTYDDTRRTCSIWSYKYSFTNDTFVESVRNVIEKYGDDPSFEAIIALTQVYPDWDEVWAGMGFVIS